MVAIPWAVSLSTCWSDIVFFHSLAIGKRQECFLRLNFREFLTIPAVWHFR